MKNKDMPAMPTKQSFLEWTDAPEGSVYLGDNTWQLSGLTKREYFAGLAMQAYLSGNLAWSGDGSHSVRPSQEEVAGEAVGYADALLNELEK